MEDRSIPKSIDYQDVLPVAVPAVARRRRYYPQNGTIFNEVGSREIRIELSSTNAMLDPAHSYLEFFVFNLDGGGATFGADLGGGHCLFDEIRVEQGGRVLAREQEHHRLHAGILSASQESFDGYITEGLGGLQRSNCATAAVGGVPAKNSARENGAVGTSYVGKQHNQVNSIANLAGTRVTMAMPTGLFTQDKLLPLPLVSQSSPLTIVLKICPSDQSGVWSALPGAGALSIERANYVAQMIEVGGDVIEQVKMMRDMGGGQLTISGQDIEHTSDVIPANSAGEVPIRIPMRKRSMKSLLFYINSDDFGNGPAGYGARNIYNISFGGNANMNTYQLKVGSVVYPPTPVNCWGNVARAAGALRPIPTLERGECAMELAKALGSLGFTNPTGRLDTTCYGTSPITAVAGGFVGQLADGDNGDGAGPPGNITAPISGDNQCICPFGLDLESFQHTAIESGVDTETMALESNLILNIDQVTSGIEAKNVHCFIIYDKHYYFNADGSITFSD